VCVFPPSSPPQHLALTDLLFFFLITVFISLIVFFFFRQTAENARRVRMSTNPVTRAAFRPSNAAEARRGIQRNPAEATSLGTPYDAARRAENDRRRESRRRFVGGEFSSATSQLGAREGLQFEWNRRIFCFLFFCFFVSSHLSLTRDHTNAHCASFCSAFFFVCLGGRRREFLASGRTEGDILNESQEIRQRAAQNRENERWRARLEARRLTTLRQLGPSATRGSGSASGSPRRERAEY
jgi:hypothetical protein